MNEAIVWFNKTLADRKNGTKGIPKTDKDSREDQSSKGPEEGSADLAQEETTGGLPVRESGASNRTQGQAEEAGQGATPQVPISDWCI